MKLARLILPFVLAALLSLAACTGEPQSPGPGTVVVTSAAASPTLQLEMPVSTTPPTQTSPPTEALPDSIFTIPGQSGEGSGAYPEPSIAQFSQPGVYPPPDSNSAQQPESYPGPGFQNGSIPTSNSYPPPEGDILPTGIAPSSSPYPGPGADIPTAQPAAVTPYPGPGQPGVTQAATPYPGPGQPGVTLAATVTPPGLVTPTAPSIGLATPTNALPTAQTPVQTPITPTDSIPAETTLTPTPLFAPALIRTALEATDPTSVKLASGQWQVVEFFAFWNPLAKSMAPIVHKLEDKYRGQVRFIYLDVDDPLNQEFKDELGYRYPPQFFILDGSGTVLDQWSGFLKEEIVEQRLVGVVKAAAIPGSTGTPTPIPTPIP